jgi:aminopeptidase N
MDDGRVRTVFARSPRMSTYLLCVVVGRFDHTEARSGRGTAVRVWTPPVRAPHRP